MTLINIGASVRDRLLAKARTEKLDFNLLLTRYTLERTLPLEHFATARSIPSQGRIAIRLVVRCAPPAHP